MKKEASMKFVVESFQGKQVIENMLQFEAVFSLRDENDANSFWIYCEKDRYPAIHMLVRNDLAVLHYYVTEAEAGSRSVGEEIPGVDIDPDENSIFYLSSNGEELEVWNDMVLSFRTAQKAIKEFLESYSKPRLIEWEDL